MNRDYENWGMEDWAGWFRKREEVMCHYFRILKKYRDLPACDELVEKELSDMVGQELMEMAYETIIPPVNSITHNWSNIADTPGRGQPFFQEPEASEEEEENFFTSERGKELEDLADKCLKDCLEINQTASRAMGIAAAHGTSKAFNRVHEHIGELLFYVLAANEAMHTWMKEKALALLKLCQAKIAKIQYANSLSQVVDMLFTNLENPENDNLLVDITDKMNKMLEALYKTLDELYNLLRGSDMEA